MTRRSIRMYFAVAGVCFSVLPGCRKAAEKPWEIVAQNQSPYSCEVRVDMGSGSGANAPDLAAGERRVLLSGGSKLVIRSVKVVCNRQEQVFMPEVEVSDGKSYLILVEADGKVRTSVSD